MSSEQPTPSRAELIEKWEKRAKELTKYPPTSVYQGAVIVVEKPSEARAIADALRDAERLDRERAINKLHREGFKRIREFLRESPPDVSRAIRWCSDSLSGYTDAALDAVKQFAAPPAPDVSTDALPEHLIFRDIELEDCCPRCDGWGKRAYSSTATWHGGVGGQMITSDVCDACWGSGSKSHPWPSHRRTPTGGE